MSHRPPEPCDFYYRRGPGGRNQGGRSTKIYVGNVTEATTEQELRDVFGKYGTVTECAKVKNYAFIVSIASWMLKEPTSKPDDDDLIIRR
jgi:RNA recognition motif-containing protein